MGEESAMTPLQMIEEARKVDELGVNEFNARHAWTGMPPIEERIAFLEWRLKLWIGNIAPAIEALASEPHEP